MTSDQSQQQQQEIRETVWRQLVDYIETEEYFFPAKIRQKITEEAEPILEEFITLLRERKMLVEFEKKSFFNKIAHWIYKRKVKKQQGESGLLEVYVKGPRWEHSKTRTYAELSGNPANYGQDQVTH